MPIPKHICQAVFGTDDVGEGDFESLVTEGQFGIIFSEESLAVLRELENYNLNLSYELHPLNHAVSEWHYREIMMDGRCIARFAQVPGRIEDTPPTAIERLLLQAWALEPSFVRDTSPKFRAENRLLLLVNEPNELDDDLKECKRPTRSVRSA